MLVHLFSMAAESFQTFKSGAFRKALVITLSSIAFGGVTIGVYKAIHSPLFLVQVVEVTTQNGDSISLNQAHPIDGDPSKQWTPIDADKISDLASIPVGEINLFDLDLHSIEKRILKNEWIREVRLQKRFPQTLSITAIFREPKAILTLENGSLAYVDTDGKAFGKINLLSQSDLPMFSGFASENASQLLLALQFIDQWSKSSLGSTTRVETLSFDAERGYRALLSYQIKMPQGTHQQRVRVDLGLPNDVMPGGTLSHDEIQRLTQVFQYLRQNSIAARQVFADSGKKIVVKTAHGS